MEMIYPKKSSQVECFGYNDAQKHLEVRFKGGGCYRYLEVPRAAFDGLLGCESAGQYLNTAIKGKFQFERLGVVKPDPKDAAIAAILVLALALPFAADAATPQFQPPPGVGQQPGATFQGPPGRPPVAPKAIPQPLYPIEPIIRDGIRFPKIELIPNCL